jgi:hypothetical protein
MNEVIIKVESSVPCSQCLDGKTVQGWMLPLFDYIQDTTTVYIKGYICSNCGHNLIYKAGELMTKEVLKEK